MSTEESEQAHWTEGRKMADEVCEMAREALKEAGRQRTLQNPAEMARIMFQLGCAVERLALCVSHLARGARLRRALGEQ